MSMKNRSLPSEVSEQRQTSRVGSLEPAPRGRWMPGICTIVSVAALGELGIHVLSLKQAVRAVSEAAVGAKCRLCEQLRKAHSHTRAALSTWFGIYFDMFQQHF